MSTNHNVISVLNSYLIKDSKPSFYPQIIHRRPWPKESAGSSSYSPSHKSTPILFLRRLPPRFRSDLQKYGRFPPNKNRPNHKLQLPAEMTRHEHFRTWPVPSNHYRLRMKFVQRSIIYAVRILS